MHVRMGGSSELQVFSGGKSKQRERERERDLHNNTEQCIPLQQYNSTQPSHTFTLLTHTNTHPAAVTQTWLHTTSEQRVKTTR